MNLLADVAALLGSATTGAAINGVTKALADRRASRLADRSRARDLLVQVVTAAAALETGRAFFRERRYSWRIIAVNAGVAALKMAAAARDGNWLHGASAGIDGMREWDVGEESRFNERVQAAGAQITPALVQLSLLSPAIAAAAGQVSDALTEGSRARRPAEVRAAGQSLMDGVASLRDAVLAFTEPPRRGWRWRRRPRSGSVRGDH